MPATCRYSPYIPAPSRVRSPCRSFAAACDVKTSHILLYMNRSEMSSRMRLLLQLLRPFYRTYDIGDTHAEVLVDDDDLSLRKELAVDHDVDRLAG